MSIGEPKIPTSEENMAKIQKKRTLSDAELIEGGAEYVVDENGVRLHPTGTQIEEAKKEMRIEKEEPLKINLPEDPELVKRLQRKLKDYRNRLAREEGKNSPYSAPEEISLSSRRITDTKYKIAILEKVLLEGEVNVSELEEELYKKEKGDFSMSSFDSAYKVIEDYCTTGGENVVSGSGF